MNRRGAVLIGVLISAFVDVLFDVLVGAFVDCHCGGGEAIGLLLRNDSGVVARSSSVFSRYWCLFTIRLSGSDSLSRGLPLSLQGGGLFPRCCASSSLSCC